MNSIGESHERYRRTVCIGREQTSGNAGKAISNTDLLKKLIQISLKNIGDGAQ